MASCRVCYGADTRTNPLLNPCDCRGSIEFIHQQCLTQWIHVSLSQQCELCKTEYLYDELDLEALYHPPPTQLWAATRASHLFLLGSLSYLLATIYLRLILSAALYPPFSLMDLATSIGNPAPVLVLFSLGIQGLVMVPAFMRLKNKCRYVQYWGKSNRKVQPIVYLVLLGGTAALSLHYTFVGSFATVHLLSQLYTIHESILYKINADLVGHLEDSEEDDSEEDQELYL